MIETSCYRLAERFVGTAEAGDVAGNPAVLAMLRLDGADVRSTSTAWCSAFVNYIAWLLRLPRSKSLAARSWLGVGMPIALEEARPAFDVVVFWRGQPTGWQGHVGFYAGHDARSVYVLGGNQSDAVNVAPYPRSRLLGVRRLA